LSPKGFEILNASPFSTPAANNSTVPEAKPTLGEQLMASGKEIVTSAGKEELRSLTKQIIGWGAQLGVGAALAAFKAHGG
jgi:hypothetical protein